MNNNIRFNPASEAMCLQRMEHYLQQLKQYTAKNEISEAHNSAINFCLQQYNDWEWMLTWHSVRAFVKDVNVTYGSKLGIITV